MSPQRFRSFKLFSFGRSSKSSSKDSMSGGSPHLSRNISFQGPTLSEEPPPPAYGVAPPAPNSQYTLPMYPPNSHPFNPYAPQYKPPPVIAAQAPMEPSVTHRFSFRDNKEVGLSHYAALADFDTVFLIDDSGSMAGANWQQTSAALSAIVPVCTAHDSDGVDIYFLNNPVAHTHVRSANEVFSIFSSVRPLGATPTGRRLGEILSLYLKSYKQNRNIKPLNIIVITDGEPTDPQRLEKTIISCARELDNLKAKDRQVGVQFFQVGSDEAATESLEELDNSLVEEWGVRDMVDTISWKNMNEGKGLSADGILKAVMGAVDKRLDRKKG